MKWPLPQDFNEAIQNPAVSFADPDLRAGHVVDGPTGVPLPHSGNYADVYQVIGADGRSWAVKCFTRPVFGLSVRYARVAEELARAQFKFTVGFTFLADGIRVRGEWRPAVKMEWVEGRPLNQVVDGHTDNPKVLSALAHRWVRLCRKLRGTGVAHGDIQHGNVLLVPGSKPGSYGLTLVDYDGMYVPALAGVPSGEAGHPNFQHPERIKSRSYSADLDRFPHLVVMTALRALAGGGRALWDRYDNGDNLLFTERDFQTPAASPLIRELWQTGSPAVRALVGRLAVACRRPMALTPWIDELVPDGETAPLDPDTEREAVEMLGPVESASAAWAEEEPSFEVDDDPPPAPRSPAPPAPVGAAPAEVGDLALPEAGSEPAYEEAPPPKPPPRQEWDYQEPESDPAGYEEREAGRRKPRPRPERREADDPRRPRRRPAEKGLTPGLIVGIFVLLGVVGAVGGLIVYAIKKPGRTTPDDQPGQTALLPGPQSGVTEPPPRPPRDPIIMPDGPLAAPPPGPDELVDPATLPRLKVRWESRGGGATISRLTFTSDSSKLVAAAYGRKELAVIDPTSGAVVRTFVGHDAPVVGVAPLPGGRIVSVAQNAGGHSLVWDPATGQPGGQARGPYVTRQAEPFVYTSPNGRFLLTGGTESDSWQPAPQNPSGVTVFDLQASSSFAVPMQWGMARFASDSARLVVAHDKTGRIEMFSLPEAKPYRTVAEGNISPALAIAISPDGRHVVYLGNADRPDVKRYHVYDGTGRRVRTLPLRPTAGFRTGFSPNGQWLILVHSSGDAARGNEVVFVDTATGAPVAVAPVGDTRGIQWDHGHRFSPDGSTLVVPKANGGLIAFDVPPDAAAARRLASRP